MNIAIPVAHFVSYNTARYLVPAFEALGHEARIITQAEFYEDLPKVDLFFGCDSGGALNFPEKHRAKSAMWFIDSRRNCNPDLRNPNDDMTAAILADGGGWVFQAQKEDWERMIDQRVHRSAWLPLGADPDVWKPSGGEKTVDVVFCGNIWDGTRADLLVKIKDRHSYGHYLGEPEELAQMYSGGRLGFNISSFYGTDVAYDVNMRVFEVMACGIPLVTNYLPAMYELGMQAGWTHVEYRTAEEALVMIAEVLRWHQTRRDEMGRVGRQIIIDGHTYAHRMASALEVLEESGIIEETPPKKD